MTLRVATNTPALGAVHQFELSFSAARVAAAHLGTGLRIVTSSDDAAGLSIASHLTAQINGIRQATANAQDARAVAGIADGALGAVQDSLQRMRRLVLAAANTGGNSPDAVMAYSGEVGTLAQLLDAIAEFTHSGRRTLLDGSYAARFLVGANGGDTIFLDLSRADAHAANVGGHASGGGTNLTRLNILGPDAADSGIYTVDGARADLSLLTESIVATTAVRTHIGAVTNQLDYTLDNLRVALANTVGARSNLIDADMADEASKFVRAQIQATAAAAVVAQANSSPAAVLRLLDDAGKPADAAPRQNRRERGSGQSKATAGAGSTGGAGGGYTAADGRPTPALAPHGSTGVDSRATSAPGRDTAAAVVSAKPEGSSAA